MARGEGPNGGEAVNDYAPPRWAEFWLERLLEARDRETVTGDVREEYAESMLPRFGRLRASLWYLRQCLSFARRCALEGGPMGKLLIFNSIVTMLCSCWLAVMELLLRHPGFAVRTAEAMAIATICLATLLARMLHVKERSERRLWPAALVLIWIGGSSFIRNARAAHFEGYVFVISIVLVLQGLLMLGALGHNRERSQTFVGA